MQFEKQLDTEFYDTWSPVDPEEDAIDPGNEQPPERPDLNTDDGNKGISREPKHSVSGDQDPVKVPKSLNEELEEKIKDNPNRFLGCGG